MVRCNLTLQSVPFSYETSFLHSSAQSSSLQFDASLLYGECCCCAIDMWSNKCCKFPVPSAIEAAAAQRLVLLLVILLPGATGPTANISLSQNICIIYVSFGECTASVIVIYCSIVEGEEFNSTFILFPCNSFECTYFCYSIFPFQTIRIK